MTLSPYTHPPDEGIDVTALCGTMTQTDHALLRRYQDALNIAIYWPDVENFRICVAAYDDLVAAAKRGKRNGTDQIDQT